MRRAAARPEETGSDPVELTRAQRYHGARLVASAAKDAEDCALLLAALGLTAADGVAETPAAVRRS
ncbi:hypothetical protein [Amycolatopsis vastitatis]|uniref:Uncharacterized protein n=1 Tax=Amycolatopsis vastitatis TaxID=1905142 RepID=A0A229T4P1_9PSEU|nr:hypothetical protein [Amycolatopsis vastitatis]OXM66226.1 hypothetical protein CF165_20540 [Amycolatopsis vastitatis]